MLHTANYADYDFFGTIGGAGSVFVGHPSELIGEPHIATWSGAPSTYTGSTTITDGSTLVLNTSVIGTSAVTIEYPAVLRMTSGLGFNNVLKTGALNIGGWLDLGDNKLITDTPAGTSTAGVYTGVQGEVQTRVQLRRVGPAAA